MTAAINWDKKENHNKPPCERKNLHVESLLSAINSCGVCFNIWEKKDADGKHSGTYDFTSLMGSDKKLILKNLPEKLQGVTTEDSSATVIKIWKVGIQSSGTPYDTYCVLTAVILSLFELQEFNEIYQMLDKQNPSNDYIASYFEKVGCMK